MTHLLALDLYAKSYAVTKFFPDEELTRPNFCLHGCAISVAENNASILFQFPE
jgi:hypothetical protein